MPGLTKIIFIWGTILSCANLFAVQVNGDGDPWGVRGTSTSSSYVGYLGYSSYGVYGVAPGGNYGVLGASSWGAFGMHNSGNWGYLGSSDYGVMGMNSNGNYGQIGQVSYAVYGRNNSGNYGYIGSSSYGVYGRSSNGNYGALGSAGFGVYGYTTTVHNAGSFANASTSGAYLAGSSWGAYIKGTGTERAYIGYSNIGISATGSDWAGYFSGDVYISGDVQVVGNKNNIIKLDDGTWTTMSATESPYPEYTISGRTKLANGIAKIEFEQPYPQTISSEVPVKVIVTPEGSYSGIYVKDVSIKGFTAVSEVGDRNATFSWMAIARVKGKEQREDYKALTAKMHRLETAMRELELSREKLSKPAVEEQQSEPEVMDAEPELALFTSGLSSLGTVSVNYMLPEAGIVNISVYDASGRFVKTLAVGQTSAGSHSLNWDSTNDAGQTVSAGVYFVRLDNGISQKTAKVTIVK